MKTCSPKEMLRRMQTGGYYERSPYQHQFFENMLQYPYGEFNTEQLNLPRGDVRKKQFWDDVNHWDPNVKGFIQDNQSQLMDFGFSALNAYGSQLQNKRAVQDQMRRKPKGYTNIPYDQNAYNSGLNDFYKAYQTGGWNYAWQDESPAESESETTLDWDKEMDELFGKAENQEVFVSPIATTQRRNAIDPIVNKLKSMGLNPSSVNDGKHNTGSKHYIGKALDLGINTTFGGSYEKMQEFKDWWDSGGSQEFAGVSLHDERTRPQGQKVYSGSHFHLELD